MASWSGPLGPDNSQAADLTVDRGLRSSNWIYREERLTIRRRGGCKRAIGTRRPMETPLAANQRRWSLLDSPPLSVQNKNK
jgi:hypothetical protein